MRNERQGLRIGENLSDSRFAAGNLKPQAHAEPGAGGNTYRAIGNFEPFDKIAVKLFELSNLGGNNDRRSADTGQAGVAVNFDQKYLQGSTLQLVVY